MCFNIEARLTQIMYQRIQQWGLIPTCLTFDMDQAEITQWILNVFNSRVWWAVVRMHECACCSQIFKYVLKFYSPDSWQRMHLKAPIQALMDCNSQN